ncbi:hypothetical protein [Prevotella denticola]|nr:hypothetical protein [Prevotella denticola]
MLTRTDQPTASHRRADARHQMVPAVNTSRVGRSHAYNMPSE